jgi:hypothetical protein
MDGTERLIATDRSFRSSISRGRWQPAFVIGSPRPDEPGPLAPAPASAIAVLRLPAGTASVNVPAGWRPRPRLLPPGTAMPLAAPAWMLADITTDDTAGPSIAVEPALVELAPLAALGYDDFAGRVRYETTFVVTKEQAALMAAAPPSGPGCATIDLGAVGGAAWVWIDGEPLGCAVAPPHRVPVSSAPAAGEHRLRVEVTTPSAARRRFAWPPSTVPPATRAFAIEKQAAAVTAGLLGPVHLILLAETARAP